MMKRDGGKIEMGVTLAAPLAIGKATAPGQMTRLNLTFPLRNGTAGKIGIVNTQSELDPFLARQVGQTISTSPVASRAYSQMQRFGTEVKLDFGAPPEGKFGEFFRFKNESRIYMQSNGDAKSVVATICHESCHGRSLQLKRQFGSQFDEFRAFTREFLFTNGRRPTLQERKLIWNQVQRSYAEMPTEKNPFTGVKQK
jgi:hypothetical protein